MAEDVLDPGGRTWTVRRRWIPRLPGETLWARFRWRFRRVRRKTGNFDIGDVPLDAGADGVAGCLVAIGLLIAAILLILFVLPLLAALVEVLFLVVLALIGIGTRIVFRRPWTVEASAPDGTILEWRVVGWRASGAHARVVTEQLAQGMEPPGAQRVTRTST